jgi:hypothetical protein
MHDERLVITDVTARVFGTALATVAEEVYMTRSFLPPLAPPPMRFDWSSWIVMATVVLLAATLALYFYAG